MYRRNAIFVRPDGSEYDASEVKDEEYWNFFSIFICISLPNLKKFFAVYEICDLKTMFFLHLLVTVYHFCNSYMKLVALYRPTYMFIVQICK